MSEKNTIRFIDAEYQTLFQIPDGANIVLSNDNGLQRIVPCKYIDEYHVQVGYDTYHIRQFAEVMEKSGIRYSPEIPQPLPDFCYSTLPSTGELILITKGKKGYQACSFSHAIREVNERAAAERNASNGITRQQEAAMLGGSLFGWSTPAARTSSYDLYGQPIKPIKSKAKQHPPQSMGR